MVFHRGTRSWQYSNRSVVRRIVGTGGDVVAAGDVLLEHVVLSGAAELLAGDPLLLADEPYSNSRQAAGALMVIEVDT